MKGATLDFQPHLVDAVLISIHAPVKGATIQSKLIKDMAIISIHAPVKGATRAISLYIDSFPDFNPRTREGCDGLCRDVL